MKEHRVFVSGGAGVIGTEVVRRLVEREAEVFVGDLKARPRDFPPEVRYRQGDLNTLRYYELSDFSPTAFIHLAATFERSKESYEFWDENYWHNSRLSHHLMTLHKDLPELRSVVFASSYLIYDPEQYMFNSPADSAVFLNEHAGLMPRNLTGMAKLAHEIELRFLREFRSEQLSLVSARIFRGYGKGSKDVISRWIRMALKGETIELYQPEGLFDYIYAADTAEGLIRLLEAEGVPAVVNLGTGISRTVAEVLEVIRRHIPNIDVAEGESQSAEGYYEASCADIALLEGLTGWRPEFSLEKAIPEMIAFEQESQVGSRERTKPNILLSSAASKIPLLSSLKNAASRINQHARVYAGDINPDADSKYFCDEFIELPPTESGSLEKISSLLHKHDIGMVIPSRDGELMFWAKHCEYFESRGVLVAVSAPSVIEVSNDKLKFSQFGLDKGFPVIPTWKQPVGKGPFVVKERFGAGSRSVGLNLDYESAITHADGCEQPIYQPYIGGREISVDAWLDQYHKVKGLVLRVRDRVVNGESRVTTTFSDETLENLCTSFLESMLFRGPVVLQLIVDADGKPNIIEVNARFGGASTASISVGLDVWYWSILEMAGEDLENYPFIRAKTEVRQIRVQSDTVIHGIDI